MQVITYVSTPWSRSINFERANIEWYPILPWDHLAAARWCEIDLLQCFFSLFWVFSILFDAFCYAFWCFLLCFSRFVKRFQGVRSGLQWIPLVSRWFLSDFKGLGGNLNPCRFRNLLMVKSLEISAKLLKTLANQRHFFLDITPGLSYTEYISWKQGDSDDLRKSSWRLQHRGDPQAPFAALYVVGWRRPRLPAGWGGPAERADRAPGAPDCASEG